MPDWSKLLTTTRQALGADNHLQRFVGRNYLATSDPSKVRFLDIGSGRHAPNTVYLSQLGFNCTAVDSAKGALAHIHADICTPDLFDDETFDCILDINTLCHVERAPFAKIKDWLKPHGKFFSIAPRWDTWRGHLEGKGFTRLLNCAEIRSTYAPLVIYAENISEAFYQHDGHFITSWIIEAGK